MIFTTLFSSIAVNSLPSIRLILSWLAITIHKYMQDIVFPLCLACITCIRDRPFNLEVCGGGLWVFLREKNCQHMIEKKNLSLTWAEKNSLSTLCLKRTCFHRKINVAKNYLHSDKTTAPPFKLNGRSLSLFHNLLFY